MRFLARVAVSPDMSESCNSICMDEQRWLLNQAWIFGEETDDDVEDQQKYCAAAMVLIDALVDMEQDMDKSEIYAGTLPQIPPHEAMQIMTRAHFIQDHDRSNIFSIDSKSMVQADSVAMQNACRNIFRKEGFSKHLQATLDRLHEIESFPADERTHRQRPPGWRGVPCCCPERQI